MLKLARYQVQGFRSVRDSGWIDTDSVTSLIGVNESGKTNLVLPLWKLSPAAGGSIRPLQDYPRSDYTELRLEGGPRTFVRAVFEADDELRTSLANLTNLAPENFGHVQIGRSFDGQHQVSFPDVSLPTTADGSELSKLLAEAKRELTADPTNDIASSGMLAAIGAAEKLLAHNKKVSAQQIDAVRGKLEEAPVGVVGETEVGECWLRLQNDIAVVSQRLGLVHPDQQESARGLALQHLPRFVYYSNYGNLDSEIYLPHVIKNLEREAAGEDLALLS